MLKKISGKARLFKRNDALHVTVHVTQRSKPVKSERATVKNLTTWDIIALAVLIMCQPALYHVTPTGLDNQNAPKE